MNALFERGEVTRDEFVAALGPLGAVTDFVDIQEARQVGRREGRDRGQPRS